MRVTKTVSCLVEIRPLFLRHSLRAVYSVRPVAPVVGTVRFDRLRQNRSDFPAEDVASLLATFRLPLSRSVVHLCSCPFRRDFSFERLSPFVSERVTRFIHSSVSVNRAFLVTFPIVFRQFSRSRPRVFAPVSPCIEEVLFDLFPSAHDRRRAIKTNISSLFPSKTRALGLVDFHSIVTYAHATAVYGFFCVSPGAPDIAVQANGPPFRHVYFSLYAHT